MKTKEILLDLVDELDAMVAFWNRNQVCEFANNAYLDWFGKSPNQIVGNSLESLLGALYQKNLPFIREAYLGNVQVFEREILTPNGQIRHSLATYRPRIVDGAVDGIFVHVADVTPLKRLEQELRDAKESAEKLATHDFLTGLPNRVLLFDRISQALSLAKRSSRAVALINIDVDGFKEVNDSYGHATGDQFLVCLATRLKLSTRTGDSVTRIGGDEFIVLAPDIESRDQVEVIASRLIRNVNLPLELGTIRLAPKVSLGIAMSPADGTTPDELMASSDAAMYVAKGLGKNCYAFASQ